MQRLIPMVDNSGVRYSIPEDRVDEFRADMGENASEGRRYRGKDGTHYTIPQDQDEAFRADMPDAVPVRTMQMSDGTKRDFTDTEMSRYLRSPEYRESEDYAESRKKLNDELGSPMWAAIKGAISGGIEGAWEGGKAGVAKAVWALPQVGTGVMRAVGNLANGLGNGRNAVGDALVRGANAADAKMEEIMPTSTAERLGYEDWGTKTGDFFGNVAGMAVKFAPAGGTSLAAKVFTEAMLASDGVNAYEDTLRTAQENGADVATANALGMVSGLVNYFGGKALLKAGGVSKDIKNPILRELAAAAASGGVMGVQGGANKAIENAATNKDIGEGVLGAVGEGFAEGALFHGANMIPRVPSLIRQTKAHFNAAKDWITEAAANDPAMLSDLMDQPALDEVIAARRKGESVSRKMGDEIFLPNNMSGEQRNAVVDSIITYRDGAAEAAKNAEATKAKEKQAAADKRGEQAVRAFREGEERARAEFNAETRKNGDDTPDAELERQPTTRNEGRGENADILQQSADQYARDDADGAKAYGSWLKKQGKKDTAANRMDWFVNDYAKRGDHPLTHRATENEIPDISREEYDKAISDWTAKKESAQKQGKKFDEPKPYVEYKDYDALLAAQKSRMDAADKAAAEAAHEERGKGLAEAFADWKEQSVKARKQGRKSPEPTAEVEDVRAKAEADVVVQRLNAEWQKAKTPAERNAIKAQLIDRLKQLGIGATERGTSAAESAKVPDGRGRMMAKPSGDVSSDSVRSELERYVGKDELSKIKDKAYSTELEDGGFPEDISILAETCRGIANRTGNPPSAKSLAEAVADAWSRHTYESIKATADIVKDAYKRDGKKVPKVFTDEYGTEPDADFYQKNAKSEEERLVSVYGKKPQPSKPLGNTPSPRIPDGKGKMVKKRYYEIIEADRLAALRSDAKVKSWAQKQGLALVDGKASPAAVSRYLKEQVGKAVAATKRLFKDAEVEVKDRDWNAKIDGENGALRDNDGRVVGTFDPATKKVTLYRGADERTVYHELIGHGVEDWARRNNATLHGKLTELARTAPQELIDDVRSRYPDADAATLTKEIIARIAEGKGLENIRLKDAPKAWYAKAYVAVRDALVGFMEKIGLNRIDLSKIDEMAPSEAMDYLMREIGKGKTLGEIGAGGAEGAVTRAEKWANKYYDRHTSLGKISQKAMDAKTLQPGKEAAFQIEKFNPKKDEYAKLLKEGDVAHEEVAEYMKAKGAEERLARGVEVGIDKATIDETLAHYENHPRKEAIERAADFLWKKVQDEGLKHRLDNGLISKEQYDEWTSREKFHVPFRSAIDEVGGEYFRSHRGMEGKEFERAEGRYSESGDPVAFIFEEYADAHLRAIENNARKVLAEAVAADANLGSIETNPNLRESRLNGDGGDRNVVSYKDIGENGRAVVKHIVLKGERGAAAASSYTNRDLMNKSPLLKKTQAFMRFWSSTATEWSPTFALRNTFADNVDLAAVVLAEKGAKEGGAWIKNYAKNRVAVAKEVWRFARKGEVDADSMLGRYVKEGGMIGGFQREGYGDLVKQFSADDIAKDFSNGGNRTKAVANKVFGLVKAVNSYAELMTRVSAFKTNVEDGMSAKDAALWSRRISVDFNRKGNVTPITNTLFMFSNSTIGATMRQLEAAHTALKTPEGRRALVGLAAFGMAEALLEHAMNADSDEERAKKGEATGKDVSEFTRKTSLYVRVGGHVFRAPAHEDPLMKLVYVANATTRMMLGDMKREDYLKEVVGGVAEDVPRFFGQGSKNFEAGFNTWVPTALQPIVQGIENKDYAGRPIYRPKFNEALPDSSNGRKSTQTQYRWASEMANELTGGNKGRKGSIDVSPETVKLISESLGKNVGKDIGNIIDVGLNILTGDFGELDSRRTPIVRDIVRKTEGNDNRYFEAVRRFNADKLDLQTRDKARNWKDGERRAYYEAHPHLRKNGGTSTRVERLINGHTDGDTRVPGINDLRRMEGGERRVKTAAGWKWRAYDWPAEKVEEFKRKRLEKQAKVLAIMGD